MVTKKQPEAGNDCLKCINSEICFLCPDWTWMLKCLFSLICNRNGMWATASE